MSLTDPYASTTVTSCLIYLRIRGWDGIVNIDYFGRKRHFVKIAHVNKVVEGYLAASDSGDILDFKLLG